MSLKVKFFLLEREWSDLEMIGPIIVKEGESYTDLRLRLEDVGIVDWPFLFWDVEDKVRIKVKLEKLNTILPKMHVISVESNNVDVAKRRHVGGGSYVFESNPSEATKVEVVACEDDIVKGTTVDPTTCSRVGGSESKSLLKSLLIPKEVMELYFKREKKLRNELKHIILEDHK